MMHEVQLGKNKRMSYSKIKEVLEMPNLIDVQKKSYEWFLNEGLKEVFRDISPITDHSGRWALEFYDYKIDYNPKYTVEECKERDAKYAAPLRVYVRLIDTETGQVKVCGRIDGDDSPMYGSEERDGLYVGDLPLMTKQGTFIINGAERVIVSQLVRSPGVYYASERDKTGEFLYTSQIIPNRGAWLEYETDANGICYVKIDRTRKVPVTALIKALGVESNEEILQMFGDDETLHKTLAKDSDDAPKKAAADKGEVKEVPADTKSEKEKAMLKIYSRLRPGEPANFESAESLFRNMMFDPKRYDLARVGRYKYNKKLAIASRINGKITAHDIVSPLTGEILVTEGSKITPDAAHQIEKDGVNQVELLVDDKIVKVFSNNMVNISNYIDFDVSDLKLDRVYKPALDEILAEFEGEEDIKSALDRNLDKLSPKHITVEDIMSTINYMLGLKYGIGTTDDIDHLGNRRVRCVGELLQQQFRVGLARMERAIRERMSGNDMENSPLQSIVNPRPVSAQINEFFSSSQLSQFMDQPNPLAELRHKRRISALGPGGLSRDRAGYEVRDVHYSHYGRMCPIETPEGPNIGLITSLAAYARIDEYGFIEAPYRKVRDGIVTNEIIYMTADVEDEFIIAQANEPLAEDGTFLDKKILARYKEEILEVYPDQIDYMDISPKQLVSVVTACIPFLENDDANRALMGSNMQCQAVPLLVTDSPIVGTGMEYKVAHDSGSAVLAEENGVVERVSADKIVIMGDSGTRHTHKLVKFARSNQSTCINQRPIVEQGERVKKNDIIADGPAMDNGELALGKNILIGFMTWEGYNYEDAVLISEELVKHDVFTSIHIEEYECESRDTKLGAEEITRDIPNVSEDALKDLDEDGIIRVGAEVRSGDILVGKVTPKGETELTAEERLLRAIFGEKAREVRDTSLRVPHGESGIIIDVKKFTKEDNCELANGVNEVVRCYIAQKRKISVGDKMAGRHGNKGVISRVLPQEDMPFLEDGTPLQIVLNPLGVPSRMNIGQVLEVHLGFAAKKLGYKLATPVFDGAQDEDIKEAFTKAGLPVSGKMTLYDGRTGDKFDNPVTVGIMYYLKLAHLVDDKIHARSTGPYSLVTQQPLGGKAQFGGQRFGEMEVWALEAYGAAYTLQEILTVKSDDIVGRVKTYEAIVKGENIPRSGIPESFKVLVKELQSLALDIKILDENGDEIDLSNTSEEDDITSNESKELRKTMEEASSGATVQQDEGRGMAVKSISEMQAEDEQLGSGDDALGEQLSDIDFD